jgi:hypothetical protein
MSFIRVVRANQIARKALCFCFKLCANSRKAFRSVSVDCRWFYNQTLFYAMTKHIKKLTVLTVFLIGAASANADLVPKQKNIPDEVTVFVTLKVNSNISKEKIAEFTKMYAEFVNKTEPDSLGWSYHQSGEKVILIERYKNEEANIITANNISPDGIRYKLLQDQLDIFTVEKVSVYGAFTKKLIDFNTITAKKLGFKFPFEYNPIISGYSKNSK